MQKSTARKNFLNPLFIHRVVHSFRLFIHKIATNFLSNGPLCTNSVGKEMPGIFWRYLRNYSMEFERFHLVTLCVAMGWRACETTVSGVGFAHLSTQNRVPVRNVASKTTRSNLPIPWNIAEA